MSMKKLQSLTMIAMATSLLASEQEYEQRVYDERTPKEPRDPRKVAHNGCYFYFFNHNGKVIEAVREYYPSRVKGGLIVIQARSTEVAKTKFRKKHQQKELI